MAGSFRCATARFGSATSNCSLSFRMCDKALFLFRQEKGEKKPTQGALRANAPPCVSPAASPEHVPKSSKNNLKPLKIFPKCATGGVHRGGCMPARERAPKRLPCAAFFGYFLVRAQESDTSPFANSPINCNLFLRSLCAAGKFNNRLRQHLHGGQCLLPGVPRGPYLHQQRTGTEIMIKPLCP